MGSLEGGYEELMIDYILKASKKDRSIKRYSVEELCNMTIGQLEKIIKGSFVDFLEYKCYLAGVVESQFFQKYGDCNDIMNTCYYGVHNFRRLFGIDDFIL